MECSDCGNEKTAANAHTCPGCAALLLTEPGLHWAGMTPNAPDEYPTDYLYTMMRIADSVEDPDALLAEIEAKFQLEPSDAGVPYGEETVNGYKHELGGTDGWNAVDIAVWREVVREVKRERGSL